MVQQAKSQAIYAKTLMFSFNLCCLNFSPQLKLYTKAVSQLSLLEEAATFLHKIFKHFLSNCVHFLYFKNNFANCFRFAVKIEKGRIKLELILFFCRNHIRIIFFILIRLHVFRLLFIFENHFWGIYCEKNKNRNPEVE